MPSADDAPEPAAERPDFTAAELRAAERALDAASDADAAPAVVEGGIARERPIDPGRRDRPAAAP